jgi:hypothetical protein
MRGFILFATLTLSLMLNSCTETAAPTEPPSYEAGKLTVTLDFQRQSGYASNQYAVWVEDADGGYIATLYATRYTANGGYKVRPDSISAWVAKSGLADMEKAEVDAIAAATPASGTQTYTWDLTGADGSTVLPGEYRFCVEGSLRWKNRVLYSGVISIGEEADTADGAAEFTYEASDGQPALTSESIENGMLGAVKAEYEPPRQSRP